MAIDQEVGGLAQVGEDAYCQVSPRGEGNQGIFVTPDGSVLIDGFIKYFNPLTSARVVAVFEQIQARRTLRRSSALRVLPR